MTERLATCRCGQLRARCSGEPVRVSVCHCLDCQTRSGSAFAVQARWPDDQVQITGEATTFVKLGDSGHRATFSFCPQCGSTVAYVVEGWPGVTAVPVGAFADPQFPAPRFSVYEHRKHAWTAILGDDVDHDPGPSSVPLPGHPAPPDGLRQPIDPVELQGVTNGRPSQEQSAGAFMREVRDQDRY